MSTEVGIGAIPGGTEDVKSKVLIIDHDYMWNGKMAKALTRAGFSVAVSDDYACCYPFDHRRQTPCDSVDLVILGCAMISTEEWQLISDLLSEKRHLLVLGSWLKPDTMRELFRIGVDDVAEKPSMELDMVQIVNEALDNIEFVQSHSLLPRGGQS